MARPPFTFERNTLGSNGSFALRFIAGPPFAGGYFQYVGCIPPLTNSPQRRAGAGCRADGEAVGCWLLAVGCWLLAVAPASFWRSSRPRSLPEALTLKLGAPPLSGALSFLTGRDEHRV